MFRTGSGLSIEFNDIPTKLMEFYERMKQYKMPFQILIGTDSQNHDKTKVVCVICMICEGHGGIFFYKAFNEPLIKDVRLKLQVETNESLTIAQQLVEMLEQPCYEELYFNCPIAIHVDAGNSPKGKTRELIPELVGWVKSCGYDCKVKPESFCASTIADKLSK